MATIALDRIRHYQHHGSGGLPPTLQFQLKASEPARVAGAFWTIAAGLVLESTAGDALIVGFNDLKSKAAAATLMAMQDLILLLPNVIYEMSFETGAAAITRLGVKVQHVVNTTVGATIGTSATTPLIVPVAFFGSAPGSNFMYGFNQFIGKNATTVTAGNMTSGGIDDKGTVGDTTPRLLVLIGAARTLVV